MSPGHSPVVLRELSVTSTTRRLEDGRILWEPRIHSLFRSDPLR